MQNSSSHIKREESRHGKRRPKSTTTFLLPTCSMTALAPLEKASWKVLLAFGSRKSLSQLLKKHCNSILSESLNKVSKPRQLYPYPVSTLQHKQFYGPYLEERYTRELISPLSCYKASITLQLYYLPCFH